MIGYIIKGKVYIGRQSFFFKNMKKSTKCEKKIDEKGVKVCLKVLDKTALHDCMYVRPEHRDFFVFASF